MTAVYGLLALAFVSVLYLFVSAGGILWPGGPQLQPESARNLSIALVLVGLLLCGVVFGSWVQSISPATPSEIGGGEGPAADATLSAAETAAAATRTAGTLAAATASVIAEATASMAAQTTIAAEATTTAITEATASAVAQTTLIAAATESAIAEATTSALIAEATASAAAQTTIVAAATESALIAEATTTAIAEATASAVAQTTIIAEATESAIIAEATTTAIAEATASAVAQTTLIAEATANAIAQTTVIAQVTQTAAARSSPSPTLGLTATLAPTLTRTATALPSPTATPGPTATATRTPSPVATATSTSTASPSPTATATPGPSPTATPAPTALPLDPRVLIETVLNDVIRRANDAEVAALVSGDETRVDPLWAGPTRDRILDNVRRVRSRFVAVTDVTWAPSGEGIQLLSSTIVTATYATSETWTFTGTVDRRCPGGGLALRSYVETYPFEQYMLELRAGAYYIVEWRLGQGTVDRVETRCP